jgi:hypothetical protein
MTISYLETHIPEWIERTERVSKTEVGLACRIDPNDAETSLAKSSNIQNQVAWLFEQLKNIAQAQTAPV